MDDLIRQRAGVSFPSPKRILGRSDDSEKVLALKALLFPSPKRIRGRSDNDNLRDGIQALQFPSPKRILGRSDYIAEKLNLKN